MLWRIRSRTFDLSHRGLIMGVLNVTPDSFSDGGRFFDPAEAVARGLEMEAEGADVLDIGGESTRPGATPVEAQEELRRILPVIEGLRKQSGVPISIDTMKAGVARAAMDAALAMDWPSALAQEAQLQRRLGHAHDYSEGVQAFTQKRAPQFTDR